MTGLSVPLVSPDDDLLSAALKYAAAGWYVGPGRVGKNPGAVLGKYWPAKTSRDAEQIVEWFTATEYDALFLHCGRTGAWVADVDDPDIVPAVLADAIDRQRPPYQSSRPDRHRRGHYVFLQPEGRMIGNGGGELGDKWGECRGRNGVIFVCPSRHEHEADGALYEWLQTGDVPEMTPELADALPDSTDSADAATDAEVARFMAEHTLSTTRNALKPIVGSFTSATGSRHIALVTAGCWAARESLIGRFSAKTAFTQLTTAFVTAMATRRKPTDRVISESRARSEAAGVIAYAIGQAEHEGAESIRARHKKPDADESAAPPRRLVLRKASTFTPRPVHWAWDTAPADAAPYLREGRFPVGTLVLAVGRGGVGKSQFAAWLTAKVTTGTLAGELYGRARSVVYAATEDSWEMTIVPRLIAAGADLDRVYHVSVADDGNPHATLTLPSDTHGLEDAIKGNDVAVLIMDPLLSLLDASVNDYRSREVRSALEPLIAVADRTRVLMLGLAHFNKSAGTDPLNLVSGSAAFGQLVRSAVAFVRDEDAEDDDGAEAFVMSTIKNNLGRENLPSLSYRIRPTKIDTPEGDTWVSALEFTGTESARSVRDILRTADAGEDRREVDRWLRSYLISNGGRMDSATALQAALAAGYSEDQVKRAKKRLGATSKKSGMDAGWDWVLRDAA